MLAEDYDLDVLPKAPKVEPSASALSVLGMEKLMAGQGTEARKLLTQAVLAFPDDPEALFHMGIYYEVAHRPDRMVRWMDLALEANPRMVLAWVWRSKCMEHWAHFADALQGYEQALRLQPNHKLAASRHASVVAHQRVRIAPHGAWDGAAKVLRAGSAGSWVLPPWQENYIHPEPAPPLRQPLLEGHVMAWDGVLSEELFERLDNSVDDYFQFAFTNGWLAAEDQGAATSWLPAQAEPLTAAELAARCLLRRLIAEDPAEFAGVEFWGRVRSESLGAGLHYDKAEGSTDVDGDWLQGNPWRPQWSSVLYLTDEGGPTVVLEQLTTHEGHTVPEVPQRAHLVMPKRNRWAVFRADLFHGTLPVELERNRMRRVFIFNFWRRHVPGAPYCQPVDYSKHPAMRRLLLAPAELRRLSEAEARPRKAPRPVERQRFERPEDMPHASDFGRLARPLPMPSTAQLLASTGLCEVDWAAAAAARAAVGEGASEAREPAPAAAGA